MSTLYLFLTVFFTIKNGVFLDLSLSNPVNYFFVLWFSMPLQLFMAIFGEIILIPIFLMGLAGLLVILFVFIVIMVWLFVGYGGLGRG